MIIEKLSKHHKAFYSIRVLLVPPSGRAYYMGKFR